MRLIIRTPDARRARALQGAFEAAEIDVAALSGPAATRPAPGGEDVVLLDGAAPDAPDLMRALRRDVGAALAYVGVIPAQSAPSAGTGFDTWIAADAPAAALRKRLESIHRDGILYEELRARRRTAAALGLSAPPEPKPPRAFTLLFVGAPSPAFLALDRAFTKAGGIISASFTSFSAFDHLHDDRFDAVVLNAVDDAPAALSLCGAMRRNAQLYHVPALVLTAPGDSETANAAFARGATMVAARDDDLARAIAWLSEDVRRARLRRISFQGLAAIPEPSMPWSQPLFAAHLENIAQGHHNRGRALTLASMHISGGGAHDEAWLRGYNDLIGLAARLVRASDSFCSIDDRTLLCAFPSTSEEGASAALQRIVSVWECTSFAAGDGGRGALAFAPRTYEMAPGESGPALLARAMEDLEERPISV